MNISSVLAGHPDVSALAKRGEPAGGGAATPAAAAAPATPTASSTAAMREILAQYDVTDISPDDFSKMIQSLYDKGAISKKDLQDLSAVRQDLDKAGVDPDDSIDLLDFYRKQVAKAQRNGSDKSSSSSSAQQQIAPMLQRLGWLEKFSLGHNQPETIGLDTTA